MKFTMDGGFSAYDFKDDEEDDADIEKLKALAGAATQAREPGFSPLVRAVALWSSASAHLCAPSLLRSPESELCTEYATPRERRRQLGGSAGAQAQAAGELQRGRVLPQRPEGGGRVQDALRAATRQDAADAGAGLRCTI